MSLARAVSVARPPDDKAPSGESAAASARGGLGPRALAGWESESASARLHATAGSPTGGRDAGAGPAAPPRGVAADPLASPAGTLSALGSRAVGPECPCLKGLPANHHPVRDTRRLRRLPRLVHPAVVVCCPDQRLLSSDRWSSPSGCSCLLCLAVPRFLSSAAHFAPDPAVSLNFPKRNVRLWATFTHSLSD